MAFMCGTQNKLSSWKDVEVFCRLQALAKL